MPPRPVTPLTVAQRDLAEAHVGLARGLARPFRDRAPRQADDYDSAACLALVEAARTFDPARHDRFPAFARLRIRGALLDVARRARPRGYRPAGDFFRAGDDPPVVESLGFEPEAGDEPVGSAIDAIDAVEAWIGKLPARHADIFRLEYLHGKSRGETARLMGCSKSEVNRLHGQAVGFLRPMHAGRAG